jgi:predicted Zn-dependent peptidase
VAQLIEQLIRAATTDATQRELDRARTQARAALLMALETPWGQAGYVARQLSVYGRLVEPSEVVEQLEAVTLDSVREAGAAMVSGPCARATVGVPAVRAA